MTTPLRPGLLVLHGNRLEQLADTVFAWLARHPLDALEEEVFLVQSNGMAEWLKMQLAAAHGVCAATRLELPARFVWRAYRAVLGRAVVPATSALDKLPLTWRLMHLLPALADEPVFAPVAAFLGPGADATRRLQLARRLADLFDQYQVYRSHWLQDWLRGHDRLRLGPQQPLAQAEPVPADQAWQPALWRGVLAGLGPLDRQTARPVLHQRFLEALAALPAATTTEAAPPQAATRRPALPRRLVLFGTTHIPHQTLEAIAALQAHCQVILAVPNPCRFHWADTIAGRELLTAPRRRQPLRGAADPAALPLAALHAHGHPLLAAWGRQARDFVRQLDDFDDAQAAQARFGLARIDLFDEAPGETLLQQVQARIRDLVPLAEHGPPPKLAEDDRSIVFHTAHSAQREVEILHDQLLHLLAHPPGGAPLAPRDIVVMVPDIDGFAPAIRAVFGQFPRGHARHIPWGLADQRLRHHRPLLVALEWLLHAPQQRFAASALRDLLDVPAIARRLGLAAEDLPTLMDWVAASGVRWGLHAAQRDALGLGACGEANTWHFGLQRLLLGYAAGELPEGFDGIQPLAEVAGLDADLAGLLAEWLDRLDTWWADAAQPRPPEAWALRLRALLAALFEADDDADRALLAALDAGLARWLEACTLAGFDEPVPLAAVREAWLDAMDEPGGNARFRAGGVTFCTLLPLRAVPFEVVCLLGMNDGDYPRRSPRNDFDLMALPGQARPGDRSRRDDDRQLMLDALLSARRVLYIGWAGRSPRDNSAQPPSVLVGQLRDYLIAGWGEAAVDARTVQHPLQPFSRRYFEPGAAEAAGLVTYAAEWRDAHEAEGLASSLDEGADAVAAEGNRSPAGDTPGRSTAPGIPGIPGIGHQTPEASTPVPAARSAPVTLDTLESFLRHPVQDFFRHRLQVRFDEIADPRQDDEPFAPHGLDRWQLLAEALAPLRSGAAEGAAAVQHGDPTALALARLAVLRRAGRLPLGGPGQHWHDQLAATLQPMIAAWQGLLQRHPVAVAPIPLSLVPVPLAQLPIPRTGPAPTALGPESPASALDDAVTGARATEGEPTAWVIQLVPGRLLRPAGQKAQKGQKGQTGQKAPPAPRPERLIGAWLRALAGGVCGQALGTWLVGEDACLACSPPGPELDATATLHDLLEALHTQRQATEPWPTALRTGLAWLDDGDEAAQTAYDGGFRRPGEGREAVLHRLFPDYAALRAQPGFEAATERLYRPFADWLATAVRHEPLPDAQPLADGEDDPGDEDD